MRAPSATTLENDIYDIEGINLFSSRNYVDRIIIIARSFLLCRKGWTGRMKEKRSERVEYIVSLEVETTKGSLDMRIYLRYVTAMING